MGKPRILFIFDSITVISLVLLIGVTRFRNSDPPPPYCLHCKTHLENTASRSPSCCIIYHWDGRKEWYCCPHCALPEREQKLKLGYQIWKTTVQDYATGKSIDATKAWYLIGSNSPNLYSCCTPNVISFQTQPQAEQYRKQYGGVITRLGKES